MTTINEERRPSPGEVFGRQVRDARRAHALSQAALAERLTAAGVPLNQGGVSRTEEGKRPVSLDEVVVMARVLGMDLPQTMRLLVEGAEPSPSEREEHRLWLEVLLTERDLAVSGTAFVESQANLDRAEHELDRALEVWVDARKRMGDLAPERDSGPVFDTQAIALGLLGREHELEDS